MYVDHIDIANCFNRAADYIDRHGWCQGVWSKIDGSVCAGEALRRTSYGISNKALFNLLCVELNIHNVPAWNDKPGMTKQEVTSTLRAQAMIHAAQDGGVEVKVDVYEHNISSDLEMELNMFFNAALPSVKFGNTKEKELLCLD